VGVAAFVAVALLFWGVNWWLRPTVATVLPQRGVAAEVVYATGVVEPVYWAKVVALQRKRIIEICHCEGQPVKKGDILANLDDLEERALLRELEARLKRLNEDAERLRRLVERNVSSRVTYDEKLTQISEYEARIAAQKDRINDLQLRAPMDGTVLRRDGEVGEVAGIGSSDVLFWVGQPRPLRVVAEVNEDDIPRVRKGLRVLLRHDGLPNATLTATVDEITPKGDPATKTFRVYFALPDDTPLQIGMSVEANIIIRETKQAILVPAEALSEGTVTVVKDGQLDRRKVDVGIRGTRMVEITSGLAENEPVVSPAPTDLAHGTSVKTKLSPNPQKKP
jgi:RND family efflux transporter MFP subunit